MHRPEFPERESLSQKPDSFLTVENRPGGNDLDEGGDQEKKRGEKDQSRQSPDDVQHTLPNGYGTAKQRFQTFGYVATMLRLCWLEIRVPFFSPSVSAGHPGSGICIHFASRREVFQRSPRHYIFGEFPGAFGGCARQRCCDCIVFQPADLVDYAMPAGKEARY